MRDIRQDLKDRLTELDDRTSALVRDYNHAKAALDKQFTERERAIEQERSLAAAMLALEQKRYGDESSENNTNLADFFVEQAARWPGISKEDMRKAAASVGFFSSADSGGRATHTTLINLVRAKRLILLGDNSYKTPDRDELKSSGEAFQEVETSTT